ncbi:MAG: PIG-L family deacetylase [Myxococcota bacterium]
MNTRILIVEDCPDQGALMARWLKACPDVYVAWAMTGRTALDALQRECFDIVLTDIRLSDMCGMNVAKAAAATNAEVHVVTANGTLELAQEAIQIGVDSFLCKPLARDALSALVRTAQERASLSTPSVLAVGAHPDDFEIGCGGQLLRHAAMGHNIVALVVSSGEAGGARAARRREAAIAVRRLGGTLIMHDLPDTKIPPDGRTIEVISEAIRTHNPVAVYTHSRHDNHQDHRAVHQATLVASRAVPNVFCYQSPSTTVEFQPLFFAPIDTEIEGKLALIDCYRSQVRKCAYLAPELIRASARYWGRFAGNRLVEPFELVRSNGSIALADQIPASRNARGEPR